MSEADLVGHRGETIFRFLVTRKDPDAYRLFDEPRFLGEKKATLDFYLEIRHASDVVPFAFFQVRATRRGYTSRGRLRIRASARDLKRLAAFPAPTYIVGVDEHREHAFIVSASDARTGGFSSISTRYPLDQDVLRELWAEVAEYWAAHGPISFRSRFTNVERRDR